MGGGLFHRLICYYGGVVIRFFKFFFAFVLATVIISSSALVVLADDETSNQDDYMQGCHDFAAMLVQDGVLTADSYFYICYDDRYNRYNAFVSSAVFNFLSEDEYVKQLHLENNSHFYENVNTYIPTLGQIDSIGYADYFTFGGSYSLDLGANMTLYFTSDLQSYSVGGEYMAGTRYWVYSAYDGGTLCFREFGLHCGITEWRSGFYEFSFPYVYTNFVPYLRIRNTDVAVTLDGVLAVELAEIEQEESSFFQVSRRIIQVLGQTLQQILPAGIIIISLLLLLRFLGRFFKI